MQYNYDPYQYPPDYELADLHQKASKPGKKSYLQKNNHDDAELESCPCCQKPVLHPYQQENWRKRGIPEDFHEYGGAIVTYFWLMRFYAFIFALVFIVYSAYLLVCIYQFCDLGSCEKYLGFWVISNENLFHLLEEKEQHDVIIRISLLRGIAYIILVVGNTMSLYIVSRFKKRYPPKKGIQNFTLIFKNVVPNKQMNKQGQSKQSIISMKDQRDQVQIVREMIKEKIPQCQIIEIFSLSQLEPYYTVFNQKIKIYYELLLMTPEQIKISQKRRNQYQKKFYKLKKLQKQSDDCIYHYGVVSDRVIVTVGSESSAQKILKKFQMRGTQKLLYLIGIDSQKEKVYAEKCPKPEEINWNYIGHHESQKIRVKIISFAIFVGLVAICYGILSFTFKVIYVYNIPSPFGGILSFLSLFLLVVMALSFRQFMNKLSQMRYPNTQTSRTMFIVITTVLFHYIFYLALPTFYFWQAESHQKNKNLLIVTNQTLTFIIVQVILAALNIMYLFWKKKQSKVRNQDQPIGCQKILHQEIEYPHFPIEFKLIAIFKIFSFITFFAFQAPAIVFFTFFLLVFLYYRDKYAIYFHFRKQIIDSHVQFRFLKFYAWFFVIYSYIVFIITQNLEVEFWIGFSVAACCIIAIFFIKETGHIEDPCDKIDDIRKLKLNDSYERRYKKFVQEAISERLEREVSEFIEKGGRMNQSSDNSLGENLI